MTLLPVARRFALASLFAFTVPLFAEAAPPDTAAPIPAPTALSIVHTLKPQRALPVVAVVAQGKAVLSDFVVPYGVLAQSGAAKVVAVNMVEGTIGVSPLTVQPDMTAAEFDAAYPDGADYVIIPATVDKHEPELAWLRAQRARGAALISICDGVELLAETGALDGRSATGHWASLDGRRKNFPQVHWVTNTRYVADGDVASSAGVSASLPISLALVETLAGPDVARATARRLGVEGWAVGHNSEVFKALPMDIAVHTANMHLKRQEVVAVKIRPDDDEVALSLHAEVWSRTMRNKVQIVADEPGWIRLRGGLRVKAEAVASVKAEVSAVLADSESAGRSMPVELDLIAQRYGKGTARLAALGMEYPWGDLNPAH